MKIPTLPSLSIFAILLALVSPGRAEEKNEIKADWLIASKPAKLDANQALFNVEFPGGSLVKFLSGLNIEGASFSVLGTTGQTPADLSVQLPPFQLRNIDVITLAHVIRSLIESQGFALEIIGTPTPNSVVCTLRPAKVAPAKQALPVESFSFQLAPFLGEQSVDDIVGAVKAAWELDPAHDPNALHLKYHPGTTLLLVSAPNEGLNIISRLISQLKTTPKSPPARSALEEKK